MLFLQFSCELSWNPSCTHFVVLKYILHNMVSRALANTKLQGNLNSCNKMVFSYHSFNTLHCPWCTGSKSNLCVQHQLHLTPHSLTSCPTRTFVTAINKHLQITSSFFYEFQLLLLLQCSKNGLQNAVPH